MNPSPVTRHAFPQSQRGAASVAIAFLILLVIGAALATALSMSGSAVRDAAMSEEQVEALFFAESGLERAAYNYGVSGACTALGVGTGATAYSLGNGTFTLDSAATSGSYCQVQVTGRVGTTMRRASANLTPGSAAIAQDSFNSANTNAASSSLTLAIGATGTNRLLLVGVYSDKGKGTVSAISYDGVSILANTLISGGTGNNPGLDVYYLVNPPTGSRTLAWTTGAAGSTVVGAVAFTGVNQSSPFNANALSLATTSAAPSLAITTAASNAWVVSFLASDNSTTATPAQTSILTDVYSTSIRGSESRTGPVATPQSVTMSWTLATSRKWIMGAVALSPAGGSPTIAQWSELVN